MTRAERTMLHTLIDRARRAQVDAQGGFRYVEADAKGHERTLSRLRPERLCDQCGTCSTRSRFCSNACRKLWHYHQDPATEIRKRAERRQRARRRLAA